MLWWVSTHSTAKKIVVSTDLFCFLLIPPTVHRAKTHNMPWAFQNYDNNYVLFSADESVISITVLFEKHEKSRKVDFYSLLGAKQKCYVEKFSWSKAQLFQCLPPHHDLSFNWTCNFSSPIIILKTKENTSINTGLFPSLADQETRPVTFYRNTETSTISSWPQDIPPNRLIWSPHWKTTPKLI